jgi:hypothetical protein
MFWRLVVLLLYHNFMLKHYKQFLQAFSDLCDSCNSRSGVTSCFNLLDKLLWRVSRMRELLKREASKQKKNECLEAVPRWRA